MKLHLLSDYLLALRLCGTQGAKAYSAAQKSAWESGLTNNTITEARFPIWATALCPFTHHCKPRLPVYQSGECRSEAIHLLHDSRCRDGMTLSNWERRSFSSEISPYGDVQQRTFCLIKAEICSLSAAGTLVRPCHLTTLLLMITQL